MLQLFLCEILYLLLSLKEVPGCCIITGLNVDFGFGTEDERLLLPQARASIGGGRGTRPPLSSVGDNIGIAPPPTFQSRNTRARKDKGVRCYVCEFSWVRIISS